VSSGSHAAGESLALAADAGEGGLALAIDGVLAIAVGGVVWLVTPPPPVSAPVLPPP